MQGQSAAHDIDITAEINLAITLTVRCSGGARDKPGGGGEQLSSIHADSVAGWPRAGRLTFRWSRQIL